MFPRRDSKKAQKMELPLSWQQSETSTASIHRASEMRAREYRARIEAQLPTVLSFSPPFFKKLKKDCSTPMGACWPGTFGGGAVDR
jgi:hypothetical protein